MARVKIEEVDDALDVEAVDQVSEDAAKHQPQGNLAEGMMRPEEGCSVYIQYEDRENANDGKRCVAVLKEAKGRAGVSPMNEAEEAVDDDPLSSKRQKVLHQQFAALV